MAAHFSLFCSAFLRWARGADDPDSVQAHEFLPHNTHSQHILLYSYHSQYLHLFRSELETVGILVAIFDETLLKRPYRSSKIPYYKIGGNTEAPSVMPTVKSPSVTPVASSSSEHPETVTGFIPEAFMLVFAGSLLIVIGGVFLTCFWKLRRGKKKHRAKAAKVAEGQIYLQQKAELDAACGRQELEASCRSHEVDGRDACHEMVGEETRLNVPSLGRIHEALGEECAREIDGSQRQ